MLGQFSLNGLLILETAFVVALRQDRLVFVLAILLGTCPCSIVDVLLCRRQILISFSIDAALASLILVCLCVVIVEVYIKRFLTRVQPFECTISSILTLLVVLGLPCTLHAMPVVDLVPIH